MNITLIGALRSIERLRIRSDFYRSWEVELRAKQDIGLSIADMEAPGNDEMHEARSFLAEGVAKGRPVGVQSKLRPDLFPVLDQMLLDAGANFGTLHDSLRLLSEYYLHDYERLSRIRSWVAPPLVIGVIASFVLPIPLLWDVGSWAYSGAILGGVAAIYLLGGIPVSLLYSVAQRSARIRRPRFAWTLAIGLEGGLTFAGAVRLAATVGQLNDVARHLDAIAPKVIKTMTLSKMVENSGLWPAMVAQIAKADEMSEYLSTLRVFASQLESPP